MTSTDPDLELFLQFVPPYRRAFAPPTVDMQRMGLSNEPAELRLLRKWFAKDDETLRMHLGRLATEYGALPDHGLKHPPTVSWEALTFLKKVDWMRDDDPASAVKLTAILLALQAKDGDLAKTFREKLFQFIANPSLSPRVQLALAVHVVQRVDACGPVRNLEGLDPLMLGLFLSLVEEDPGFVQRSLKSLPGQPVYGFPHGDHRQVHALARALRPLDVGLAKELLAVLLGPGRELRDEAGARMEAGEAARTRLALASELADLRARKPSTDRVENDRIDWALVNAGDAASAYWQLALAACSRHILAGDDEPASSRGSRRAALAFYLEADSLEQADALLEFEMWAMDVGDLGSMTFKEIYQAVQARAQAVAIVTDADLGPHRNSAFAADPEHPIVLACYRALEGLLDALRDSASPFYLGALAACACHAANERFAQRWDQRLEEAMASQAAAAPKEAGRALCIVASSARSTRERMKGRQAGLAALRERLLPGLQAVAPDQAARVVYERDRDLRDSGEMLFW